MFCLQLTMDDAESDSLYAFVAKLENIKPLSNLLKSLSFKERANFFISPNGMKVTVEESKCMQLSAFIEQGYFHQYLVR
ncbi:cell cycle checkpoint protein RAD1-like [Eurytemora carolleeae]|uniref:cell cycle checkpoint protein RAD1-like n=1 Tax=Eurytemora carolleeae TaxID=1294199 RepID=UPI000C775BD1|nr:cell cycle checkpoint protein RAD1-like [Eurytemora carolleeae]|eukprot:XP_023331152.1 cell cycle checkpoint protein RAD1-like [Eurytemora affinis]